MFAYEAPDVVLTDVCQYLNFQRKFLNQHLNNPLWTFRIIHIVGNNTPFNFTLLSFSQQGFAWILIFSPISRMFFNYNAIILRICLIQPLRLI